MILFIDRIFKNGKKELIYKTNTQTQRMNLQLPGGECCGGRIDQEFGIDMYTLAVFKIENQQGPTIKINFKKYK